MTPAGPLVPPQPHRLHYRCWEKQEEGRGENGGKRREIEAEGEGMEGEEAGCRGEGTWAPLLWQRVDCKYRTGSHRRGEGSPWVQAAAHWGAGPVPPQFKRPEGDGGAEPPQPLPPRARSRSVELQTKGAAREDTLQAASQRRGAGDNSP